VVLFGGWTGEGCDKETLFCPAHGDTWTWDGAGWTRRLNDVPPVPPTSMVKEFANATPIVLPLPPPAPGCPGHKCEAETPTDDSTPGRPLYPSPIAVAGMTEKVSKVTVTLKDLSWTKHGPADADIMLVAPDGKSVMVMSDACGNDDAPHPISRGAPITVSFSDVAPSTLPAGGPCTGGTYRPSDVATSEATPFHSPDAFPAPAPRRADSNSLAHFGGIDPNGTWSLYVVDDAPADPDPAGEAGRIAGGWTLRITTGATEGPPPAPVSPPARGWGAMAYHGPSAKVVLYGGSQAYVPCYEVNTGVPSTCGNPFNPLADTWTWDGTAWAQEGSGTNPGLRQSASMAFHPGSGQLVLFGGSATGAATCPTGSWPARAAGTTRGATTPGPGTARGGRPRRRPLLRLPALAQRWPRGRAARS
jgi:hypothetical protein